MTRWTNRRAHFADAERLIGPILGVRRSPHSPAIILRVAWCRVASFQLSRAGVTLLVLVVASSAPGCRNDGAKKAKETKRQRQADVDGGQTRQTIRSGRRRIVEVRIPREQPRWSELEAGRSWLLVNRSGVSVGARLYSAPRDIRGGVLELVERPCGAGCSLVLANGVARGLVVGRRCSAEHAISVASRHGSTLTGLTLFGFSGVPKAHLGLIDTLTTPVLAVSVMQHVGDPSGILRQLRRYQRRIRSLYFSFEGPYKSERQATRTRMRALASGLAALPKVGRICVVMEQVSPRSIPGIFKLPNLRGLEVSQVALEEADMLALASADKLEELRISAKILSSATVEHLRTLRRLRVLTLEVEGRETRLGWIWRLERLRHLTIFLRSGTATLEPGEGGKTLPELLSFAAVGTGVGDEIVRLAASAPALRVLTLMDTGITDRGISMLGKLRALRILHISWTRVGDAVAEVIRRNLRLQVLVLRNTNVGNAAAAAAAALPSLRAADLSFTRIDDGAQRWFYKMQRLRHLDIRGTKVTPRLVRLLCKHRRRGRGRLWQFCR